MRQLSIAELNLVSGGNVVQNLASTASEYGEAALFGAVISQAGKIPISRGMTATQGGAAGIGAYGSWKAGTAIGNWLNNNTPIQDWIATGIDKVTGLDKAGVEYDDASTTGTNTTNQPDKSGSGYGN
ncbi:MAG: hypothetical protein Q4B88_02920 [Moraxella sp.]|nr:hypothetical protein [Moraxella sp.]